MNIFFVNLALAIVAALSSYAMAEEKIRHPFGRKSPRKRRQKHNRSLGSRRMNDLGLRDLEMSMPQLPPVIVSNLANPGSCNIFPDGARGCTSEDGSGSAGNPNDIVVCFENQMTPLPFEVQGLNFWLNDISAPLPDTLSVRIWCGDQDVGPQALIGEEVLVPGFYSSGLNTVYLSTPVVFDTSTFCVGVYSGPVDDGFRMETETPGDGLDSFVRAPDCEVDCFASLGCVGFGDRKFCIEALVNPVPLVTPAGVCGPFYDQSCDPNPLIGCNLPSNSAPTASCQDVFVLAEGPSCEAAVTADQVNNGSFDPEDGPLPGDSLSISPKGPYGPGETIVTLTVTDSADATGSCFAKVTVTDDEAPVVDCGERGVIAPCEKPVILAFGAQTKANGCKVPTTNTHIGCFHCNGAGKTKTRDCTVLTSGNSAWIVDAGGVKSHIVFEVVATNDNGLLSDTDECTICTQNPSVDFIPGCSPSLAGGGTGGGYVCDDGFPYTEFTCVDPRQLRGYIEQ